MADQQIDMPVFFRRESEPLLNFDVFTPERRAVLQRLYDAAQAEEARWSAMKQIWRAWEAAKARFDIGTPSPEFSLSDHIRGLGYANAGTDEERERKTVGINAAEGDIERGPSNVIEFDGEGKITGGVRAEIDKLKTIFPKLKDDIEVIADIFSDYRRYALSRNDAFSDEAEHVGVGPGVIQLILRNFEPDLISRIGRFEEFVTGAYAENGKDIAAAFNGSVYLHNPEDTPPVVAATFMEFFAHFDQENGPIVTLDGLAQYDRAIHEYALQKIEALAGTEGKVEKALLLEQGLGTFGEVLDPLAAPPAEYRDSVDNGTDPVAKKTLLLQRGFRDIDFSGITRKQLEKSKIFQDLSRAAKSAFVAQYFEANYDGIGGGRFYTLMYRAMGVLEREGKLALGEDKKEANVSIDKLISHLDKMGRQSYDLTGREANDFQIMLEVLRGMQKDGVESLPLLSKEDSLKQANRAKAEQNALDDILCGRDYADVHIRVQDNLGKVHYRYVYYNPESDRRWYGALTLASPCLNAPNKKGYEMDADLDPRVNHLGRIALKRHGQLNVDDTLREIKVSIGNEQSAEEKARLKALYTLVETAAGNNDWVKIGDLVDAHLRSGLKPALNLEARGADEVDARAGDRSTVVPPRAGASDAKLVVPDPDKLSEAELTKIPGAYFEKALAIESGAVEQQMLDMWGERNFDVDRSTEQRLVFHHMDGRENKDGVIAIYAGDIFLGGDSWKDPVVLLKTAMLIRDNEGQLPLSADSEYVWRQLAAMEMVGAPLSRDETGIFARQRAADAGTVNEFVEALRPVYATLEPDKASAVHAARAQAVPNA